MNNFIELLKVVSPFVVLGITYYSSRRLSYREKRIESYERMIKAYWKLLGLVSENKLTDPVYYAISQEIMPVYMWCTKEMAETADALSAHIVEMIGCTDEELSKLDEKAMDELVDLIKMSRKSLGLGKADLKAKVGLNKALTEL